MVGMARIILVHGGKFGVPKCFDVFGKEVSGHLSKKCFDVLYGHSIFLLHHTERTHLGAN